MYLQKLLQDALNYSLPPDFRKIPIASLSCDSRTTERGSLFVALSGFAFDGAQFVKDAVARGAVAVVCQSSQVDSIKGQVPQNVFVLGVDDPKNAFKRIVSTFYGAPSQKVRTLGVTGTNGKTTTTYLMEAILQVARKQTAVVGTINYRIGTQVFPSKNTTPGLLENQKFLNELVVQKIDYCLMEVSSHALDQGRVDLIDFKTAIFTNLTGDHLDYHKTFENYFLAKAKLFQGLSSQANAVINVDDPYGVRMKGLTQARVVTFGIKENADVRAVKIEYGLDGTTIQAVTPKGNVEIRSRLIGQHNVYNILGAVAAAIAEEVPLKTIALGIRGFACVPGRLEAVDAGQDYFVFIDYAHTQDGMLNVLRSLRSVSTNKIILVFGCGGDRDKTKRPLMAEAACQMAHHSIVTTDNCRSESPEAIIADILKGFSRKNFEVIMDRKDAIERALMLAGKGEIVLLAGKGHEMVQIFKDRTIEFNERKIVEDFIHSHKNFTHV